MPQGFKTLVIAAIVLLTGANLNAQDQATTKLKVQQLIERKSEYHRLTNGVRDGYRIKIHFAVDRESANAVKTKFTSEFSDIDTYIEYQQPNWVVLLGDFNTKLEAFETQKRIQYAFPNAFIVKDKINPR